MWALLLALVLGCGAPPALTPWTVSLPAYITPMPVPADNPMTVEGVELGRRLFYDPLLGADGVVSCASCHQQARAFTDGLPVSVGAFGRRTRRNSMPLFNLAWSPALFWDGRAASLEEQVLQPIEGEDELARDLDAVLRDLAERRPYPALFAAAFPGEGLTRQTLAKALAQFVRSLVSFGAPIDQLGRGFEPQGAQLRGSAMFEGPLPREGGVEDLCNVCHEQRAALSAEGPIEHRGLFTDNRLRHNGLPADPGDRGRAEVSGRAEDEGLFRVPSMRNAAVTGPYFHDGRAADLPAVLEHYNTGLHDAPTLDPVLRGPDGAPLRLELGAAELEDMTAVMDLFTDTVFLGNPLHGPPAER